MTEPRQMLWYVVGDEITARMYLWHRMNLLSVEVVFEHHEDPNITLTLSGVPEFKAFVPSQENQEGGNLTGESYRTSEVLLSGEVDLEHIPGEYVVSRAEFYTASGQEIQHDIRPDKPIPPRIAVGEDKFRVVPEPSEVDEGALVLIDERLEEVPPSTD